MSDLEIIYLPAGALAPYPRNARTHSRKQIRQIAESITQFGFTNPLLIDSSNMILASNQAATTVLIEDHGSGTSLIQLVRSTVLGVKGITHQSDKETRMYAATPLLEGGLLHLPKTAPWLDDFQDEFLAFPNGKYDDQMDALSQFLNWHGEKQRSFFQADWGWDDTPQAPSAESLLGMLRR